MESTQESERVEQVAIPHIPANPPEHQSLRDTARGSMSLTHPRALLHCALSICLAASTAHAFSILPTISSLNSLSFSTAFSAACQTNPRTPSSILKISCSGSRDPRQDRFSRFGRETGRGRGRGGGRTPRDGDDWAHSARGNSWGDDRDAGRREQRGRQGGHGREEERGEGAGGEERYSGPGFRVVRCFPQMSRREADLAVQVSHCYVCDLQSLVLTCREELLHPPRLAARAGAFMHARQQRRKRERDGEETEGRQREGGHGGAERAGKRRGKPGLRED
eukprot:3402623-Rhodomonas_salina.4